MNMSCPGLFALQCGRHVGYRIPGTPQAALDQENQATKTRKE